MKRVTPKAAKGSRGSRVGTETKADMTGAFKPPSPASTAASLSLAQAVSEVKIQHPVEYWDHGPHHGTDHHRRNGSYSKV